MDVVGEGVVNANKVIMIKLKNVHAIQFSNAHLQVSSVFNMHSPLDNAQSPLQTLYT